VWRCKRTAALSTELRGPQLTIALQTRVIPRPAPSKQESGSDVVVQLGSWPVRRHAEHALDETERQRLRNDVEALRRSSIMKWFEERGLDVSFEEQSGGTWRVTLAPRDAPENTVSIVAGTPFEAAEAARSRHLGQVQQTDEKNR
jgi:hypothetical protein